MRGPRRAHLTAFYLTVSAGGALGGVLVAIVAPLVFDGYYELGIGLVALGALAALRFRPLGPVPQYASLAVLFAVAGAVAYQGFSYQNDVRVSSRSFYGVLRVKEYGAPGDEGHLRRLVHGAIMHGEQYLTGPWRSFVTSYYQEPSGVGAAIRAKQLAGPVRVGVIGLGTGTLAAYGREGDTFRFYDIDPRVMSSPARSSPTSATARRRSRSRSATPASRSSARRRRTSTCWRWTPSPATPSRSTSSPARRCASTCAR